MIFIFAVCAVCITVVLAAGIDTFVFVGPRFDGQEDARRGDPLDDHYRGLRRVAYDRAHNRTLSKDEARAALVVERHPTRAS